MQRSSLDFEGSLAGLSSLGAAPPYRPPADAFGGSRAPAPRRGGGVGAGAAAAAQWGGGAPLTESSLHTRTMADVDVEPPPLAPPPAGSTLLRARRGSGGGGGGARLQGPRALGSAGKEPKRPALRAPPPSRSGWCCCMRWLWV
jgi:hypothetical protein